MAVCRDMQVRLEAEDSPLVAYAQEVAAQAYGLGIVDVAQWSEFCAEMNF